MKAIAHIALYVKDMEKSLDFYTRVLGGKYAFSFDRDGKPWIEYVQLVPGQFIELFYGATVQVPYRDENAGFFHLCLQVEDIQATWKQIVESGAPQDDAPKTGGDGNWQCWTHDPDGVKIELMQVGRDSLQMQFIRSLNK